MSYGIEIFNTFNTKQLDTEHQPFIISNINIGTGNAYGGLGNTTAFPRDSTFLIASMTLNTFSVSENSSIGSEVFAQGFNNYESGYWFGSSVYTRLYTVMEEDWVLTRISSTLCSVYNYHTGNFVGNIPFSKVEPYWGKSVRIADYNTLTHPYLWSSILPYQIAKTSRSFGTSGTWSMTIPPEVGDTGGGLVINDSGGEPVFNSNWNLFNNPQEIAAPSGDSFYILPTQVGYRRFLSKCSSDFSYFSFLSEDLLVVHNATSKPLQFLVISIKL